jgi:hypothetical protein
VSFRASEAGGPKGAVPLRDEESLFVYGVAPQFNNRAVFNVTETSPLTKL